MKIKSLASMDKGGLLVDFEYDPGVLQNNQIAVKISHCGICHSDLHLMNNDWQNSQYPLVPGHEVIGTITELGKDVEEFKIGQRVGIGWQCGSCGHCEWCLQGDENLCANAQATCLGHYGGFAEAIYVDQRFAFAIPDALRSEEAAPLLCGGATVFSPLKRYIHSPTMRVGVVGIGGLGHLGLQFAHAFGCEVTAFSTTPEKKEDAIKLGAHHFVCTQDINSVKKAQNSLDFLLVTSPGKSDWEMFSTFLRPRGVISIVGVGSNINVSAFTLIGGRKTIAGSNIASCPEIKEMLAFAARQHVVAQVEIFSMRDANSAIEKIKKNQVHYRAVLKN